MIALLARGASHYLLGSAAEAPTETEEHDEAYVEIGAVMLGFGVFLANAAFEFEQFDDGAMQGWRYASQGVLGQDALGYALALFVELAEVEQKPAIAHLAPNARAAFKWARSQLQGRRRHVVDGLRDVARVPDGDGPYR
jgi:hypothetical protein